MSQFNKRCTGTNCDWRGHCAVALKPREYMEQIMVPLKEYTADWCDMYQRAEPAAQFKDDGDD